MVKAESFACTINSTSGRVVASVRGESVGKSSCKTVEFVAYGLDKDSGLPEEILKSLTERLRGPLRLSGVDSIVTQSSSRREGPTTVAV